MNVREIRLLYAREMRAALRERNIVINSLLLPLVLYPLMLWAMFAGIGFVRGQEERFVSRVALEGLAERHGGLREALAEDGSVELVEADADGDPAAGVRAGELDAHARVLPPDEDAAGLAGNFRLLVTYDASKDRSVKARERVGAAVETYRESWVEREARERGAPVLDWEVFRVERRDVASGGERGAFLLGIMAPMLTVIMIAVGCFYPAIDTTAGERERSTWETLMTTAAARSSVVVAKFLYVATLGAVAGLLNLAAITVSMRGILTATFGDEVSGLQFALPLRALPLVVLNAFLLALFIAAGMMLFAVFARTFKEGQSMIGPFYMLVILPAVLVQSPDLELTAGFALVPIANVVLLFRDLIGGEIRWALAGLTIVAEVATIALLLAAARWVLQFEDVLVGSYSGSLGKFLKERLRGKRTPGAGGAR